MKKVFIAIAMISILLYAQQSSAFFYDGSKLEELANSDARIQAGIPAGIDYQNSWHFGGYVMGVVDTLDGITICIPADVKAIQVAAIVKKYLKDHPEECNESGAALVVKALVPPFGCKKK
jgi:hypothetical protein